MATRWRGLLAPINQPTGDGRRMAPGAFTHRPLPLPLKWQRTDEAGHDTSVVVGLMDTLDIDEANGQVWGGGELFDDVNPATTPRLAEDVAEAKLLVEKKVLGPSVDPGSAQAVTVLEGSNTPLDEANFERMFWESGGKPPPTELLFTNYEIAAATLVPVPAFAECRPFELTAGGLTAAEVRSSGWSDMPIAPREHPWDGAAAAQRLADDCGLDGDSPDWDCYASGFLYRYVDADPETKGAYGFGIVDHIDGQHQIVPAGVYAVANVLRGGRGGTEIPAEAQGKMRAVVSSIYKRMMRQFDDPSIIAPWDADKMAIVAAAEMPPPDPELFADPQLAQVTPLTRRDLGNGWVHVFGHIATHDVCLVGVPDVCTTAPYSDQEYTPFHRYSSTTEGISLPLPVGRLTSAHGRLADSCTCCRGNDDHACSALSFGGAVAHHDQMQVLAYVRAGEDELNNAIWISGVQALGLDRQGQALLRRQKVSGDWRYTAGNTELAEVLALARREPGFPLPRVAMGQGHQLSLTAAGVVRVDRVAEQSIDLPAGADVGVLDYSALNYATLGGEIARALAEMAAPRVAVTAAAETTHIGAMMALRMTEQDAARLCVTDGLPMEEMHLTLAYLGNADEIPPEVREKIEAEGRKLAAKQAGPIVGDGFALSAFNPGTVNKQPTTIVVGVGGEGLQDFRNAVMKGIGSHDGWQMPPNHTPWVPHVSLQETDDLSRIGALADRVGPVTFDRLRLAFGGEVIDIPLEKIVEQGEAMEPDTYATRATALTSQIELTVGMARAQRAAELTTQIQGTRAAVALATLGELAFNPRQIRDRNGRWTRGGGGSRGNKGGGGGSGGSSADGEGGAAGTGGTDRSAAAGAEPLYISQAEIGAVQDALRARNTKASKKAADALNETMLTPAEQDLLLEEAAKLGAPTPIAWREQPGLNSGLRKIELQIGLAQRERRGTADTRTSEGGGAGAGGADEGEGEDELLPDWEINEGV